jgi:hypothetical protein
MQERSDPLPPVGELIDAVVPAAELERLERVDALLRAARPRLRLVAARAEPTRDLKLTFRELSLIYRALQAARTLGVAATEKELLEDTIQLVNQALDG